MTAPSPPVRAARRTRVAGLLLLAAAALSACGSEPAPPEEAPAPAPIVFLLLDTLRADHTSVGTHRLRRQTTPFLEELAAESFVFERAYSAASWTRPSVASIFTSRLPAGHACEDRGDALSEELTTLAEVLEASGYHNRAVLTNAQILAKNGFAQGFHSYVLVNDYPRTPYADAIRMRQPVIQAVDAVLPLEQPWFLYLHYVDPHDPYIRYEATDFSPEYEGPADGSRESLEPYRGSTPPAPEKQRFIDLYDSNILFLDHELRRLFRRLDERGLLERAWIVVTSDHGEGLWDHRIHSHGTEVYEHQIRVPLLLRPPGGLSSERRISEPFSQIDLAPTLLELVGLPVPEEFDGQSWAGALVANEVPPVRPIVVVENLARVRLEAIIDDRHKLIRDSNPDHPKLYYFDLAANPREQPDAQGDSEEDAESAVERSVLVARLDRLLRETVDAALARRPDRVSVQFDAEEVAALAALGYLQHVTVDAAPNGRAGDEPGAGAAGESGRDPQWESDPPELPDSGDEPR